VVKIILLLGVALSVGRGRVLESVKRSGRID